MDTLPEDIVTHICTFLFGRCWMCSKSVHYSVLTFDLKIREYRTVFDDEFGFETLFTIPIICDGCTSNLSTFEGLNISLIARSNFR